MYTGLGYIVVFIGVLFVILHIYLAQRDGLLSAGVNLVSVLISYLFTVSFVNDIGELIQINLRFHPVASDILAFLVLCALSYAVVRGLLSKLAPSEKVEFSRAGDLVGGAFIGGLTGFVSMCLLCTLVLTTPLLYRDERLPQNPVYKVATTGLRLYAKFAALPGASSGKTLDVNSYFPDKASRSEWVATMMRVEEAVKNRRYDLVVVNVENFLKLHSHSSYRREAEKVLRDNRKRIEELFNERWSDAKSVLEPEIRKLTGGYWNELDPNAFRRARDKFDAVQRALSEVDQSRKYPEFHPRIEEAKEVCVRLANIASQIKRRSLQFAADEVARLLREQPNMMYARELKLVESRLRGSVSKKLNQLRQRAESLMRQGNFTQALSLWQKFVRETTNPSQKDYAQRQVNDIQKILQAHSQLSQLLNEVKQTLSAAGKDLRGYKHEDALKKLENFEKRSLARAKKLVSSVPPLPAPQNPVEVFESGAKTIRALCKFYNDLIDRINTGPPKPLPFRTNYKEPLIEAANSEAIFYTRYNPLLKRREPQKLPYRWSDISPRDALKLYKLYLPGDHRIRLYKQFYGID